MKTLEEHARELTHLTGQYIARQAGEAFYAGKQHGAMEKAAEHAAQRDEKDALISHLTARVATLERALAWIATVAPDIGGLPVQVVKMKAKAREAMDAQPAASLNRIAAAALREAKRMLLEEQEKRLALLHRFNTDDVFSWLGYEAERLEAGEGDHAQ